MEDLDSFLNTVANFTRERFRSKKYLLYFRDPDYNEMHRLDSAMITSVTVSEVNEAMGA